MASPDRPVRPGTEATASPDRPLRPRTEAAAASPGQLAALADDLLEEIFLRLSSTADLACAYAACASFRRVIIGPSFLRRYRSTYPPLLLGFLNSAGFHPAEAPHPSAPAARALARAGDFSFDGYLPRGRGPRWFPCDVRDGLVLLENSTDDEEGVAFPDLAVCDPLSRRYLLLPPIPDDLLVSVQVQKQDLQEFEAFLAPAGGGEDTSFRVIARTHCEEKLVVLIFRSGSGSWSVGTSASWNALSIPPDGRSWQHYYAYGCFYWKVCSTNKLLKFNMSSMELSTVELPSDHVHGRIVIAEAGEGRLGMFSQICVNALVEYYTIARNEDEGSNEWRMESIIPLRSNYCYIKGAQKGYVFVVDTETVGAVQAVRFSIEIKTLKIERVSRVRYPFCHVYPYFDFPPFMSLRRI